ncbi:hypothetical protein AKJ37_03730 [candidate division MSBL1 archaeon SCGC-AAA259I09]|uniref:Nudix hydrolase domain-containing protein n=1 Tax=candidate division MSBL1 archaeon SCGC-AAA259I09 TaxID=1698267 RepID=A0A133USL3_9EURY|nr:hypothetical protein AKJ37_03730 [candidate division MSBL1 archaeon SCGC-AAA259I09]
MEIYDEHIPDDLFEDFLSCMPQVSVELFLIHNGKVLLAKRRNKPLKGEWFWPGGRLYKGEKLKNAARRIAREELGIEVKIEKRLGVYCHFWNESPFEKVESVHTVNVVFQVRSNKNIENIELDEQHEDYRLVSGIEPDLHEYVKRYMIDSGMFEENE